MKPQITSYRNKTENNSAHKRTKKEKLGREGGNKRRGEEGGRSKRRGRGRGGNKRRGRGKRGITALLPP